MTEAVLDFRVESSQAVTAKSNLDNMAAAATKAETAQQRLAAASAGSNAGLAKIAAGVEQANVLLAKLVALTDSNTVATTKLSTAKQTVAKATVDGARSSQVAAVALKQEAAATDLVTAAMNRHNAAERAMGNQQRAREAAGLDVWGRTADERATARNTQLALGVGAANQNKASPVAITATARGQVAQAETVTRAANAGAQSVKALGAGLSAALLPVSILQFGIFSLASAATEWATSMLTGASKTEKALEGHKRLIDEIAKAYPHAAEAAKLYEDQAGKLPQPVVQADIVTQQKTERDAFKSQMDYLQSQMSPLATSRFGNLLDDATIARLNQLSAGLQSGALGAADVQKRLGDLRLDPSITATAKALLDALQATANAAKDLETNLKGSGAAFKAIDGFNGPGGLPIFIDPGRGASARNSAISDETTRLSRMRRSSAAEIAGINARSPDERRNAARLRAEATVNSGETPAERSFRIETAGATAYAQALHVLDEAQKQRSRSLDQTLASQQVDLDAIGKTAGAAEAMRMQFQLTQQVREEAARNNVPVDQRELEMIKAKTEAYGKMADQIARAQLGNDLSFERSQLFLSPDEQAIASRLRGTGIGMNSPEADEMRRQNQFADAKGMAKGFLTDFQSELIDSGGNIGKALGHSILNALSNSMSKAWEKIFDQLATAFASALTGQTPGSGGIASAGTGILGSVLGGDNDNYAKGAVTRAPLAPIGGGSVAEQSWNFFKSKGLADHQVAGILGNIKAESAFNPSAIGDAGKAFGLFQNHSARGGGQGLLSSGVTGQLNHAWGELTTSESGVLSRLRGATDVRGATAAFAGFERPAGWSLGNPENAHNFTGRLSGAEAALDKFGGTAAKATNSLGSLGDGMGKMGNALSQFPAAPGGGGSGGGILGSLFGGLSSAFSGTKAFNFLSSNPGKFINFYADGTEGAPPGWAWVGEQGPELRKLRGGDVIRSNPRSMEMVANQNRGPAQQPKIDLHVTVVGGSGDDHVRMLAKQGAQEAIGQYNESQTRGGFGEMQRRFASQKG